MVPVTTNQYPIVIPIINHRLTIDSPGKNLPNHQADFPAASVDAPRNRGVTADRSPRSTTRGLGSMASGDFSGGQGKKLTKNGEFTWRKW
jgi:hypothetical protein